MLPVRAVANDFQKEKIWKLLINLWINNNSISDYILAFIHKSLVNEKPEIAPENNERLEFLWDAVLELVVTKKLYLDFPKKPEWELTDIRSSIVRWRNLANVAKKLWFEKYLLLWKGEELTGWRNNDYLLANCVESFLWALYLDLWYDEAAKFVINNIYSNLNDIIKNSQVKDFKSLIQEYTQWIQPLTPNYKVLEESWPDHNKKFISAIYLDKLQIWVWEWMSKKKSQEAAAKNAMDNKDVWNINFK